VTEPENVHPGTSATEAPGGPLAGVVVVDLSRVLAGPYATMLLADLGAEVIKVESPGGDETRSWRPPVHEGESTYFQSVNRNKRSIILDFRDSQDLVLARRLIARADVVVENFKPGALVRFGLDAETLTGDHPRLVWASLTGFGHEGQGARMPGYDVLVQAASGLMHVTGNQHGEATKAGVAVFDVVAGLHLYGAVLAALLEREQSGKGQIVRTNLLSAALSGLVNQSGSAAMTGASPRRMGNDHPSLFPYGPLATADVPLVVATGNDHQFKALCTVLEVPEAAEDPRWSTMQGRTTGREVLRTTLEDALQRRSAAEWEPLLTEAGVPCAPILDLVQGLDFAESLGLAPRVRAGTSASPANGTACASEASSDVLSGVSVANPVSWSRSSVRYDLPAPNLDQHREDVLAWLDSTEG
jgi:crotonobetainyl-CoA:carnitine CoA-transferase CaiB-like acyl-CoA transferase